MSTIKFRLQERDIEIIKQVHKHRFLNSEHIRALTQGSNRVILKRLQALYHNQYLDRPRQQIAFYQTGSQPMIYALGNKGADLLNQNFNIPRTKVDWTSKNRETKPLFLHYTLLISNFMVCLELACRRIEKIRVIKPEQILARAPERTQNRNNPYALRVKDFSVMPDKLFGLHFPTLPEAKPLYFFLEADRATMPVKRKNLSKTSFLKKCLATGQLTDRVSSRKPSTFKMPVC